MAEHGKHDWIQGAVKHPGALTAKAKAAGDTLSEFMAKKHTGMTAKQVALAKTFKKMK